MLTHLLIMAAAAAAPLTDPAPAEPVVAASPPVPQPVSQPVSEAMAEAIANKARKKRDPSVKKEAPLDYPDSEKASGNGGRVYIRGIIGTDGRLIEAAVVRTNASPVLTASALKAATDTEFHPAKDAAGAPIAVVATLPIEFVFEDIRADTVSYVEPVFGDAERAAGLTGTVTVGGLMNTEGRLVDAKVLVSSRSPELDAAAMTAAQATVYRVDRDGDGKPLEASFRRSYEFYSYKAKGGKGILTYTCGQFARDQIWWRANWPEDEKSEIYSMMVGLGFIVNSSEVSKNLKGYMSNFNSRWDKAIVTCQKKPDVMFIDVFTPEGTYARGLAQYGG